MAKAATATRSAIPLTNYRPTPPVKAATFPLPVMLQASHGRRLRLACVAGFAAASRQRNAALECPAVPPDNALPLLLRLLPGKIRRDVF